MTKHERAEKVSPREKVTRAPGEEGWMAEGPTPSPPCDILWSAWPRPQLPRSRSVCIYLPCDQMKLSSSMLGKGLNFSSRVLSTTCVQV